jgi:LemA protein
MIAGIVVLAVAVLLIIFVVAIYNGLVTSRNRYKNAFAQIDVQLKRRYDLIPNLIEVAKKYLQHERETLEAVIQARNQASSARSGAAANPGDPKAMQNLMGAEAALGGTLGRLFALSESYPDLKANQNMTQLSEELTSTENKISFARQAYNDAVTRYNTQREKFPAVIVANSFNFNEASLFEVADESERQGVKVQF